MGRVVRFSEFDDYFRDISLRGIKTEGTILDANVIITLSLLTKKYHTRLDNFVQKKILGNGIALFTTVNTTQEYLEY